ncbi:hypothetical protein BJ138DRAFT_1125884 [Hygrophoropsis aurantiaca]|uniref:Uncharacterized protein n=1 Tax=Hygrophoropsis aurantiaca TaxID=72124 RepID=A0ACB8AFB7_9AGAM|nr:hypothetical protein BJ138DRAFT_1125884 [Hygrophoropsis aurantiaca]
MLHRLPTEIALHITSYLPLYSLYNILLVSHQWKDILIANESSVYRNAALLHQFVAPANIEMELAIQHPQLDPHEWRKFCRRRIQTERGWRGRGPSSCREYTCTGRSVHRIKVDDAEGIVITSGQNGGLVISDLVEDRMLWSLPPSHVVPYAHCEYDRGFVIFNRADDCKEVWRRSRDFIASDVPVDYPPDEEMLQISHQSAERYQSNSPADHGHFKPWALLRMPTITSAFRFAYPTLITTAMDCAYLWDIPTSRLVQVISNIQTANAPGLLGRVNYVEVNDRYAFICGSSQLRIFERESGTVVFHVAVSDLPPIQWDVLPQPIPTTSRCLLVPCKISQASHVRSSGAGLGDFMAVHVSPSGKDLVALTRRGSILILRDFEQVITKQVPWAEAALQINFSPGYEIPVNFSSYLAFGDNGKVAVATRKGIFILSIESDVDKLSAEQPTRPGVFVCRVQGFDSTRFLTFITCLQMTDRGVYFNWEPRDNQARRPPMHIGPPPIHDPAAMHGWAMQLANELQMQHENQINGADNAAGDNDNPPPLEHILVESEEMDLSNGEAVDDDSEDEPPILVEDIEDTAGTSSQQATDIMDPASPDLLDLPLPGLEPLSDSDDDEDPEMDEGQGAFNAYLPPLLQPIITDDGDGDPGDDWDDIEDDGEDEDPDDLDHVADLDNNEIHVLIDDWFVPLNLSTVISINL